jgi:hypothetical protein
VILWADKLGAGVIYKGHIACMVFRLSYVYAHVTTCLGELLNCFAVLKFFNEDKNRASKSSKIVGVNTGHFIREKFMWTFGFAAPW